MHGLAGGIAKRSDVPMRYASQIVFIPGAGGQADQSRTQFERAAVPVFHYQLFVN